MFRHNTIRGSTERIVEPELLDELPPQDRRARRSRVDLQRLNKWMNHSATMAAVLDQKLNGAVSPRIVELGAGDGHFLLSVARRMQGRWASADATLVDQLDVFDPQFLTRFRALGWSVCPEIAGACEWLRQLPRETADALVCNLFLHQFQAEALGELLRLAAPACRLFIALEPRRSWLPRLCGHCLWFIGCGPVTRHDARISIRAGFLAREISALWPDDKNWELIERPVGLFSHLFIASRKK